jgi:hypothetical protein
MFEVQEGPLEPLVCVGEEEECVEEAVAGIGDAVERILRILKEQEVSECRVEGMDLGEAGREGGMGR